MRGRWIREVVCKNCKRKRSSQIERSDCHHRSGSTWARIIKHVLRGLFCACRAQEVDKSFWLRRVLAGNETYSTNHVQGQVLTGLQFRVFSLFGAIYELPIEPANKGLTALKYRASMLYSLKLYFNYTYSCSLNLPAS